MGPLFEFLAQLFFEVLFQFAISWFCDDDRSFEYKLMGCGILIGTITLVIISIAIWG